MDVHSFRTKKVKYFVQSIGLTCCSKWKDFTKDLGVQVTEELKLATQKEWDEHERILCISKMQTRKLDIAMQNLLSTSPADLTINKP